MRIAILTHSTDPYGSVVHALALGEALCGLGHEAVVHAPDPSGRGFFRDARCPVLSVAARPVSGSAATLFGARIADYLAHFSTPAACDFDVFHAQCAISGNALATLTRRRLIAGFVRTVHRLEAVADPQLALWQERSIVDAGRLLCVDQRCAAELAAAYDVQAEPVGNGVDGTLYRPEPEPRDAELRRRLGLGAGPVLLSVGAFEPRKETLAILEAFAALRQMIPSAQLVLAGGVTRPEHAGYAARCAAALEGAGFTVGPGHPVVRTGPLDQADMPSLYRIADALVTTPSGAEQGLCALEAAACGTPVVAGAQAAGATDWLPTGTPVASPRDPLALAAAMRASLETQRREHLLGAARAAARDQAWESCAARHLPVYAAVAPVLPPPVAVATGSAAWNIQRVSRDA